MASLTPGAAAQPHPAPTPGSRTVFDLAWPLAIKAVMFHGIVVIDAYLVSSLGEAALAAMGLASALSGLLVAFLFAFSSATQIRIAQAFGTGDAQRLKAGLVCGIAINLAAVAVGLLLILVFGAQIIAAFAHTPPIAADALGYLYALSALFIFEAFSQCIGSYFNGCGRTRVPLYSYALSLPLNVVISAALIHGLFGMPELGLIGAAIGSSAAALIRVVFLALMLRHSEARIFSAAGWHTGSFATALGRHLRFSLPIAATFVSAGIAQQVCMLLYATLDVTEFAAMTLIMPWIHVAGTVGMAWAQSTGIVIAQMLGAQTAPDRLDLFLGRAWRGVFVAAALVACTYLAVCLLAESLYAGLEASTTAALLGFIPVLVLLPFPKCSNAICGNTLRAAGDTVYVMNLFLGAQWLFKVPLTAALTLYFDVSVTWILAVVLFEEIVKLPGFHLRIFAGRWKSGSAVLD
jgi:Na+-driven multidrug efflux pump